MTRACSLVLPSMASSARAALGSSRPALRDTCAQLRMALNGDRSSCDRVARNRSFARFASSASPRALSAAARGLLGGQERLALGRRPFSLLDVPADEPEEQTHRRDRENGDDQEGQACDSRRSPGFVQTLLEQVAFVPLHSGDDGADAVHLPPTDARHDHPPRTLEVVPLAQPERPTQPPESRPYSRVQRLGSRMWKTESRPRLTTGVGRDEGAVSRQSGFRIGAAPGRPLFGRPRERSGG